MENCEKSLRSALQEMVDMFAPTIKSETRMTQSQLCALMRARRILSEKTRAVLLNAIHNADNPIYCDTDNLICSGREEGAHIKATRKSKTNDVSGEI